MSSFAKPRSNSSVLFYAGCEDIYSHQEPHFLESCFLCHKHFGQNNDIFMYRGNTPFCSDECRQEQIEIDEAKERPWSSYRRKTETSTKTGAKKTVRTGTIVVA